MSSKFRVTPWSLAAALVVFATAGFAGERPGSATQIRPPGEIEVQPGPGFESSRFEIGHRLFREATFDGNGRTCATCHDPRNEYTMTPALAQARFRRDPSHPLFRPKDSNDGEGRDYTNVLEHAVFRVTLPLHENISVVGDPFARTILVWRGVPTIANADLTAPYLQDGRATRLEEQALGAIHEHMEPLREPFPQELEALAVFEREIFYPLRMRALTDFNDPVPREPGFSVPITNRMAVSGRRLFEEHCATCHGGELGHRPGSPHQSSIDTVFVSEANRPGFPVHRLRFQRSDGTHVEVATPDPGFAARTGRLENLNAFDTPMLRGLKHTAPYFHDNSAKTLLEVIQHYDEFFDDINLSRRQMDDLVAYLEAL